MGEWRDISTAPSDQRSILAVHINSGIQKVCWRRAVGDANYEYGGEEGRYWRPTHWMHLPAPPKKFPT